MNTITPVEKVIILANLNSHTIRMGQRVVSSLLTDCSNANSIYSCKKEPLFLKNKFP